MTGQQLKKRLDDLKTAKSNWNNMYQILGQYFLSRKQGFTSIDRADGEFLNSGGIWDTTGIRSVRAFVSAVIGAIWKSRNKAFRLRKPKFISDTDVNKKYYEDISTRLASLIDEPPSNILPVLTEAGTEFTVFGAGGIRVKATGNLQKPFIFRSWSMENLYFDLGEDGEICSLYYEVKLKVKEIAKTYGEENLSASLKNKLKQDPYQEVWICEGIEPQDKSERTNPRTRKPFLGVRGMPYKSWVFEVEEQHTIVEQGYEELPIFIARCYVQPGETYPRSLAMDCLPAEMEINSHRETFVTGSEIKAAPPVVVLDDGSLSGGGKVLDLGAHGVNVFNAMGQLGAGQLPIQPIFTVGELQSTKDCITELKEEISQHFLIDRLYDLNNKTRMTLGEAEMRYSIRNDALAPIYTQLMGGWTTPIINRCFNIAYPMGLLGVVAEDEQRIKMLKANGIDPIIIPNEIAEAIESGMNAYDIEYITPAAAILRAEEYRGSIEMIQAMVQLGEKLPEILDRLDADAVAEELPELTGGSSRFIRGLDKAQKIRDDRAAMQQQMMAEEQRLNQAKANQSNAQAFAATQGVQQNNI